MSAAGGVGKVRRLRALGDRDIAAVQRAELGELPHGRRAKEQLEFHAADGNGLVEVGDGLAGIGCPQVQRPDQKNEPPGDLKGT